MKIKFGYRDKPALIVLLAITLLIGDRFGFWRLARDCFGRWFSGIRLDLYRRQVKPASDDDQLRKELASCLAEKVTLEEENLQSRRLLDAGFKSSTKFSLAKVVGSSRNNLILAISGSREVKKNASVVSGRIFLGKTQTSGTGTARALLLGSPDLRIPVKTWAGEKEALSNNQSLASGLLIGESGRLIVNEVLASEKVRIGDLVGTVIETGEIFLVGKINQIFPSEDKVFQSLEVSRSIDPRKLLTVAIVDY